MASLWKRMVDGLLGNAAPASDAGNKVYPNTYQPKTPDEGVARPQVFDPALKQYMNAFRLGDPVFAKTEMEQRWREARRRVMDHILQIVSQSPWNDHLVLRGSRLLKAWFGDAAREPGDLDWVVSPTTIKISDRWASQLHHGLIQLIAERPRVEDADLLLEEVAIDEIWTYDRAPGSRIVFPWRALGLPSGVVQFDVVFGEELAYAPVQTSIRTVDGGTALVWAASKVQSLAWKLLWLETDSFPQGKDLYDATLLAEEVHLPLDVLQRVLSTSGAFSQSNLEADFALKWDVDWSNFKQEYPWVEGEARAWQVRLAKALESTFAERNRE